MKKYLYICMTILILIGKSFAEDGKISIDVNNAKIRGISDNKIIGSFEVKNNSSSYSNDLYYMISLVSKKMVYESGTANALKAVLNQSKPECFSIAAEENKLIVFEYVVPEYISSEDTMIVVNFMSRTSTFSKTIGLGAFNLGESDNYIYPSNYDDTHGWENKENSEPLSGPSYDTHETPIGYISVKSSFNKDIICIPEFTVYKRLQTFEETPVGVFNGDEIKLKANETKNIEIEFPKLEEPDSYLIKAVLKDVSGKTISYEYFFRYVIKGINAKILGVSAEHNEEESSLYINTFYVGSADGSAVNNAIINIEVYDSLENKIATLSDSINLMPYSFKLTKAVPLKNVGEEMNIIITIKSGEKTLDTYEYRIEGKATEKIEGNIFSDIAELQCYDAVKLLNALGIVNGYPDGTFKPYNTITRAEVTSIALKLKNIDVEKDIGSNGSFIDVSTEHWAADLIETAYKNGIINGYEDGTFRPDNQVSYSEAITILVNVIGYRDDAISRQDIWPMNYIQTAAKLKIQTQLNIEDYAGNASRGNVAIMALQAYLAK